jgi:diguanylate cyclase (GGDEF)-like protein
MRRAALDTVPATRHARAVTDDAGERPLGRDRGVRMARRAIVALLILLALDALLVVAGLPAVLLGGLALCLVGGLAVASIAEQRLVDRATTREATTEATLNRMLRGLSRSVSADATVNAIVDELRDASGADHVVIARLKPAERIVEATLVSSSAAVPLSVTRFPASDLEPMREQAAAGQPGMSPAGPPGAGPRVMPVGPGLPGADGAVRADRRPGALVASIDGVAPPAAQRQMSPDSTMHAVGRIADRVCRAYGLRHILAEPLVAQGRVIGALVLSRRTDTGWPRESRELLRSSAQDLSAALERAFALEDARMRAATDALTGIPNRAYFDELVELLGRGRRANDGLGILMLDLDHFKALNDRYGHVTGDRVLRAIGDVLRSTVRTDDVPARYGGEEFVVVLRRATDETATEIAERVRRAVRFLDRAALGVDEPVTVSVGVAVGVAGAAALVERADAALYRAKRRGRDRIEVG